jgi:mycoredoxin
MQDTQRPSSTEKDTIKMFATTWCGDCRMAKRWLDAHNIPYEYINIEQDEQAAAYVMQVNRGMRTVPTIVFPDGSVLVEPSARELAAKFSMR